MTWFHHSSTAEVFLSSAVEKHWRLVSPSQPGLISSRTNDRVARAKSNVLENLPKVEVNEYAEMLVFPITVLGVRNV